MQKERRNGEEVMPKNGQGRFPAGCGRDGGCEAGAWETPDLKRGLPGAGQPSHSNLARHPRRISPSRLSTAESYLVDIWPPSSAFNEGGSMKTLRKRVAAFGVAAVAT